MMVLPLVNAYLSSGCFIVLYGDEISPILDDRDPSASKFSAVIITVLRHVFLEWS